MSDWGLVAFAYALFHVTHGIADYWVQTDWQAQNKSSCWAALRNHAATYTLSFIPAVAFIATISPVPNYKLILAPAAIMIPHMLMDCRKPLMWWCRRKGWFNPDDPQDDLTQAVRTFVAIEMDQKYHYLCLLLTAVWLVS